MSKRDQPKAPRNLGRKPIDIQAVFKVEYVPLPSERVDAWRSSLSLIVDWVVEDLLLNPDETSKDDATHEQS